MNSDGARTKITLKCTARDYKPVQKVSRNTTSPTQEDYGTLEQFRYCGVL